MFLQAGRNTPGHESDPAPMPECRPGTWMLQKIPLIFFGRQRRMVLSAEVPFWLRRWRWGHWFVMGCRGEEMPGLHFDLLERGLFSFLIKLRLSWSNLSCGLQPWETHSLWVTNSGEEGGLTSLSWEMWWKGRAKQGEIYLFLLPGSHSCAHLAWAFTDDESSPWKSGPVLSFWEEMQLVLGFCKHRFHGEKYTEFWTKINPSPERT